MVQILIYKDSKQWNVFFFGFKEQGTTLYGTQNMFYFIIGLVFHFVKYSEVIYFITHLLCDSQLIRFCSYRNDHIDTA